MSTAGKPIQCRAAVSWERKKELSIETITVDPPKENEIRIKMVAAGICYSDVHSNEGNIPEMKFPLILGHEGAGIVESVGANVTLVKAGDSVMPVWFSQCGKCPICLMKTRNLCVPKFTHALIGNLFDGTTRISCKGQSIGQFLSIACFSEYTVVPDYGVIKLKPNTPLEKVALYGCCMPTGYGAVTKTSQVKAGSIVVVIGLGAVGLSALLGARDAKAARVIGVDTNSEKMEIGLKFGATEFVNPNDHPGKKTSDIIKGLTGDLGADYVFVAVGNKLVIEDALETARMSGGEAVIIGVVDDPFSVSVTQLLMGKTLKGTWGGDFSCSEDLPKLIEEYLAGKFPTDLMITHKMPLERVNEAFDLLEKGKCIKIILTFD